MTLISCIVPCFDGERFLGAALDSILAQDHRPLELLVVDDGSADRSVAIAERYGDPVRVLRQAHRGPAAARSAGIAAARGEYVAFLDADDLYLPGKLAAQLAELEQHPDADLCLCICENFWEPGLEVEQARYAAAGKLRGTHHPNTLLVRRSVFEVVGVFDSELIHGDYVDWFLRVAEVGLARRVVPTVFVARRLHDSNHSRRPAISDAYIDLVHASLSRRRATTAPLGSRAA